MIYSWTMVWFFWKVPSWLFYLSAGEILISLAYALAVNLLESLVVLCAPVILSLSLPAKWFRDVFVARGGALAIAGLGCMMYVAYQFTTKDVYPDLPLKSGFVILALALTLLLVYLAGRIAQLKKIIEAFADRATIFLYIWIPLSILSFFVILARRFA